MNADTKTNTMNDWETPVEAQQSQFPLSQTRPKSLHAQDLQNSGGAHVRISDSIIVYRLCSVRGSDVNFNPPGLADEPEEQSGSQLVNFTSAIKVIFTTRTPRVHNMLDRLLLEHQYHRLDSMSAQEQHAQPLPRCPGWQLPLQVISQAHP